MIFQPNKNPIRQKSFTLLELLIVLGILAILAVIVILVINPAEYLRRTRDTKRQTDLQTLNSAIAFSQGIDFGLPLGLASTVYVSLPDSTTTCANLGLPALPPTWLYHCSNNTDYQKTNGIGWIPINFNSLSTGSPLANLPIDPVNASTSDLYYVYVTGGSWELTGVFESQKYANLETSDGGHDPMAYEIGSDMTLAPYRPIYTDVGSDCALYHAYWDGTAVDHSGHGKAGTVASANYVSNGLQFDGISSRVAFDNTDGLFDLGTDKSMTLIAWVKPNNGLNHYPIFNFPPVFTGYGPGQGWKGYQWIGLLWTTTSYLWSYPLDPVTSIYSYEGYYNTNRNLIDGAWHMIHWGINRPVGGYAGFNGSWVEGPAGTVDLNPLNFYHDNLRYIGYGSTNDDFNGIIGEVYIFKNFLSNAELADIFNATKGRYGL